MARQTTEAASVLPHLAQMLRANWRSWFGLPAQPRKAATAVGPTPSAELVADTPIRVQGAAPGWLRVLTAEELLQVVQADKALREIWRRTRLAQPVWQRDCLSAIQRYAEFVQLLPASEAHHHAHAGGLLAHTIEMLLAALAWRGGRLLPEGAPIEIIDAQRDEWTLVVFYSALLHDIAKPISDLQVSWRTAGMADGVRWQPMSGSLNQVSAGKTGAEYLVEFTPKSLRDYRAHSRLAMLLLPHIASPTALAFLARQPAAFETLQRYLSGEDKDSLVARIVREADKASTRRALQHGSRARFATATAVPLVDLLMQAVQDMLRKGTELPLNRSGAAAWVFEDSIWFVAKRLADATRSWIKANVPDEAVPGDDKNDRLFDTWQEYGCLVANPLSGQAIWYVTVHGLAEQGASPDDAVDAAGYAHSLSMLRFPLAKVYEEPNQYPAPMRGRIEVLQKRSAATSEPVSPIREDAADSKSSTLLQDASRFITGHESEPGRDHAVPGGVEREAAPVPNSLHETAAAPVKAKQASRMEAALKAPAFNKPKQKDGKVTRGADRAPEHSPEDSGTSIAAAPPAFEASSEDSRRRGIFESLDPAFLLEPDECAGSATDAIDTVASSTHVGHDSLPPKSQGNRLAPIAASDRTPRSLPQPEHSLNDKELSFSDGSPLLRAAGAFRTALVNAGSAEQRTVDRSSAPLTAEWPSAVLLRTNLPPAPGPGGKRRQASEVACEFMRWVQASLVDRSIKFNESGAVVHFVPQGMALVSPLIFKMFAELCIDPDKSLDESAMHVQRELIRAGWHLAGPNRTNIVRFSVIGRGDAIVGRLAAVVLVEPGRWVQPVPPSNPALRVE